MVGGNYFSQGKITQLPPYPSNSHLYYGLTYPSRLTNQWKQATRFPIPPQGVVPPQSVEVVVPQQGVIFSQLINPIIQNPPPYQQY